jgi:N utilization substance protein B
MSPQKFREIIFQLLYSADFGGGEIEDILEMLMHQLAITKRVVKEAHAQTLLILEKRDELDERIKAYSKAYELERIPRVERNVLRLGFYELFHSPSIPPKVAISEAMRLTRKFATKESATFVNAILDAAYQEVNAHAPALSS